MMWRGRNDAIRNEASRTRHQKRRDPNKIIKNETKIMKLRIKFTKHGPVRFIGHLDVMRYFQKAIRRAGIDVTYTTGFSPHQVMSFAAPLGVGLESNGEYMDISVNSLPEAEKEAEAAGESPCACVVRRLNAVGADGLEAVSARILPENAGNAMASVAAAAYTVRFREGREPDADLTAAVGRLLAKERIVITKQTKRGEREIDLRPGIYGLELRDGALHMLLDASSAGNIKPALVVEALLADSGESLARNALLITREDLYTREGDSFRSLGEIGSETADCPAADETPTSALSMDKIGSETADCPAADEAQASSLAIDEIGSETASKDGGAS